MKLTGYLDHIDLGIDPESEEKAILVRTTDEFFKLSEEQQYRAWTVIKVASEILEKPVVTIYKHAYAGKMPSKVIKKNALDRHGLILVKPYKSLQDREARRAEDQQRISTTLKKSLKQATWLLPAQRVLIEVIVNTELRNIESELFGKEGKDGNKGITEGNHETIAA